MLSKRYRIIAVEVLVVIAVGAGIWAYFQRDANTKPEHATVTVTRGDIENLVTATGSLQPRDYVDVGAQVSGQLKLLHFGIGSEVKSGDLLAEIDATVYLAKVDATRAQLRNQNALLMDRKSQLRLAEINHTRQNNLMQEDATTLASVESAEASLQSARAQIASLTAQIEQTSSTLREEEANLEFARIYAPMDGTVVSISARRGQTLNANQSAPTILRLADLSIMTVQAQVSEADVSKLYAGMSVYFTTLGGEGRRWYSTLSSIEPTPVVNNNVVLYNALFDVPNQGGILMTQMTAQVFFVVAQAKDVISVPASALKFAPRTPVRPRGEGEANAVNGASASALGRPESGEQLARADGEVPAVRQGEKSGARRGERAAERAVPAPGTLRPRAATVQVVGTSGSLETRDVMVGVSNRVQAEIISGLKEGDEIVLGTQAAAPSAGGNNRMPGGGQGGMPRMMR